MKYALALLLTLPLWCAACTSDNSPPPVSSGNSPALRKVQLQLNWFPETEHGGYYAAQVHGYFAEEGLEVEILPGGTSAPVIQQVASRQVPFAVAGAHQVIAGRAQDAQVVALAAPLQHSPRCIMVHASSGIRTFEQLENVTLAVGDGDIFVDFLKQAVPLKGVTFVPYSGNVGRFVQDKKFAQQAYVSSEPFVAQEQGSDPYCLMVSELGYDPYTSLLITHSKLAQEEPELVQQMTRAVVRGWRHYLQAPDETNQVLLKLNADMTPESLAFGVEKLRTLCLPDGMPAEQLGQMTVARWQTLADQMLKLGAIDALPAPLSAAFLPLPETPTTETTAQAAP